MANDTNLADPVTAKQRRKGEFDVHSIKTRLSAIGLAVPLVLGMVGSAVAQEDGGSNPASCNYPGDLTGGKPLVIVIEGLGDPSSGFFRTLNNGAQQAGQDLCVEVRYIYPQGGSFDLASYTQQIEQSIASQPDGIVILGIGPLDDVAQRAVDAGIAVGFQPAPSVKDQALRAPDDIYVSRVGADEYAGGAMAANRFIADGAKSLVCVQQDPADGTQSMRCQGMADVAAEAGVGYELVAGSPRSGPDRFHPRAIPARQPGRGCTPGHGRLSDTRTGNGQERRRT